MVVELLSVFLQDVTSLFLLAVKKYIKELGPELY